MQVDFFIANYPDGTREIYDLATNCMIDLSPGNFFEFGFKTKLVRHLRQVNTEDIPTDYFFVMKV